MLINESTEPTVYINLNNICHNFDLLLRQARTIHAEDGLWPSAIPVIKSDAYGHGLLEVAEALLTRGMAKALAVGSVEEAVTLRAGLAQKSLHTIPILSLLGAYTKDEAEACARYQISPVVQDASQLPALGKAAAEHRTPSAPGRPLGLGIKQDTGMGRLGLQEHQLEHFAAQLQQYPFLQPQLLLSHLAAADTPEEDAFTQRQVDSFSRHLAALRRVWPGVRASLFNTAGTLSHQFFAQEWATALGPHTCRPGIALYGANPLHGSNRVEKGAGLKEAMQVSLPVMTVKSLPKGHSISYGRTYTAERDMRVAVIRGGYADGVPRTLSNKGWVCIAGQRAPIVGRVCMQMFMVDISALPEVKPGDAAWLLGGEAQGAISIYELADWWGTIPYEVYCILGRLNRRVYSS